MRIKRQLGTAFLMCLSVLVLYALFTTILVYVADPSSRNPYADRMHTACIKGDTGAVRAMIQRGADVNAPVWEDTTALMWACTTAHPETVRVLLSTGASVRAESSHFGSVGSWGARGEGREAQQVTALLQAAGAKL